MFCDQWKLGCFWIFFLLMRFNPSDCYNTPKDLTIDKKHCMLQIFGPMCALVKLSCSLPLQIIPSRIPEDWIQPFTCFCSALLFKNIVETRSSLIFLAFYQISLKLANDLKVLQVNTLKARDHRKSFSLEGGEEEEKTPTNIN